MNPETEALLAGADELVSLFPDVGLGRGPTTVELIHNLATRLRAETERAERAEAENERLRVATIELLRAIESDNWDGGYEKACVSKVRAALAQPQPEDLHVHDWEEAENYMGYFWRCKGCRTTRAQKPKEPQPQPEEA